MLLIYTITMGYIGFKFRLKKKGQAMVEMMLLIALLVPILIYSVNTIRTKLGGALTGFLTNELRTQVRYGYSYQEMEIRFYVSPYRYKNFLEQARGKDS